MDPTRPPAHVTSEFIAPHDGLEVRDDFGLPYTLLSPLIYYSQLLRSIITVPSGFDTDLASIPSYLQVVLPKSGRYDRAAVIHDYLYRFATVDGHPITRGQADSVLLEAMNVLGVDRLRRIIIYSGVRIGGGASWTRYRAAGH